MNKILDTFGKPRVFLPVVHCMDTIQVQAAVDCAFQNGADGVFLINQGGMLVDAVLMRAVKVTNDGRWAGVSLLGYRPVNAMTKTRGVALRANAAIQAVWNDGVEVAPCERENFEKLTSRSWRGPYGDKRALFFGGVAFKYRAPVVDDVLGATASAAAAAGVDVITTSGSQTGAPPTVAKVKAMREGLGDHALAVASGITTKNVKPFLPYVDAFLVATGIEKAFGTFDPGKVRALADAIHAGAPS